MRPALALAFCLLTSPALADEIWSTEFGEIIYEEDREDFTAVFSIPANALNTMAGPDLRGMIYIYSLGGNFTDRYGVFEGYWTAPGEAVCDTALTPAGGKPSRSWGRVQVIFDRPAFPSGFTMLAGNCFWDPVFAIRAETTAE